MRTRRQGAIGPVGVATGLTVLLMLTGLTGCAATPVAAPPPAPPPEHVAVAGVGDEVVLMNCEMFVPIATAAEVLGVPVAELVDQPDPPRAQPSAGVVAAAMAAQAVRQAGGHQCRYVLAAAVVDAEAGAERSGPEVLVTVLPNAAAEFGRIEPDGNTDLSLRPAPLGDQSFMACGDGDRKGCRAEVLTGTTWLSIAVQTPDPDPAAFQDYATGVVESLGALKFAQPPGPARPDCGTLLSPRDLSSAGALVDATGGDILVLDDRGSQAVAAQARGGLVGCAWSGGDDATSSGAVELTILPGAAGLWGYTPPVGLGSSITLQPVDLADEPGARWPASGVESLAGCADDQCQVTLVAEGVWLTVTTTGAAGLPGTTALATAAYARYAAAVV